MSMPRGTMLALRSFLSMANGSSQENAANSSRVTDPPNFSQTNRANPTIWSLDENDVEGGVEKRMLQLNPALTVYDGLTNFVKEIKFC